MEDGHKIFDYNVNINDVIQLMVKPILNELTNCDNEKGSKSKPSSTSKLASNKENVRIMVLYTHTHIYYYYYYY